MKKYILLIITMMSGILISCLWYVSPILKSFPVPTGSYDVGIMRMELQDTSRNEMYSDNAYTQRKVMINCFYPARRSFQEKQNYLSDKIDNFTFLVAQHFMIPQWIAKRMFTIKTNTYANAPWAEENKQYPVVLFSHGLLGVPTDMYMVILEDLASNGFIVVAIDHPYLNILTRYDDGTLVTCDKLQAEFQRMGVNEQKNFQSTAIDVYKADMRFVLDQLMQLNKDQNNHFYHRFDLDAIAVMGHSAGGTAAIELCRIDGRVKACVDLDGWYDHIIGDVPIKQPLLLIFGSKSVEVVEPTAEYLQRKQLSKDEYYEREKKIVDHKNALCNSAMCNMIIIDGASHGDFGDEVLFKWPLRQWSAPDAYVLIQIINNDCLQFLEKYLTNK